MTTEIATVPTGAAKIISIESSAVLARRKLQAAFPSIGAAGGPFLIYDRVTTEKINELQSNLESVSERVNQLEAALGMTVIDIRDVTDRVAKREIKAFYEAHHGDVIYPDDVANELSLDVLQTIQICRELAEEGEIGEAKEA